MYDTPVNMVSCEPVEKEPSLVEKVRNCNAIQTENAQMLDRLICTLFGENADFTNKPDPNCLNDEIAIAITKALEINHALHHMCLKVGG